MIERKNGTVVGPQWVLDLIADWPGGAIFYGSQWVEAPDPLHSEADLAVLLAFHGHGEPPMPEELPEGAVG